MKVSFSYYCLIILHFKNPADSGHTARRRRDGIQQFRRVGIGGMNVA